MIRASWPLLPHLEDLNGSHVLGELGPRTVELTLDILLQRHLKQRLAEGRVLRGGSVLLEMPSGRVIAAAGHSEQSPPGDNAAFESFAASASTFKIITAAALLRAGVPKDERVCYHGGVSRMRPSQLLDNPRRDRRCTTLFQTVPLSQNNAIAKLALKHLSRDKLLQEAYLFGFNRSLAPTWQVESSSVDVPVGDSFELARTSAGFTGVMLSPLHAAAIAATIGNGGVWVQPRLLESPDAQPPEPHRVMSEENAALLTQMLLKTTTAGTATRRFARPEPELEGVEVAGKTGSLTDYDTQIHTSWFVGFAPVQNPRVAVAVAILNDMDIWHIQAVETARLALEAYFSIYP